jgi:hypothetical protein
VKLPVPKSTLIAGGGMLVIAGIIINAERSGPSEKTTRERPTPSAQRSASPQPASSVAEGCPNETTVEDPTLKIDPEFIKKRYSTKTCSRIPSGEINGCLDADEAACKKRLDNLRRFLKTPGECLARPAELFCSVHALANGNVTTACFETSQACDSYHEKKKNRPRICRTATACERIALPQ